MLRAMMLAASLVVMGTACAEAAIRIQVSFGLVMDEVSPEQKRMVTPSSFSTVFLLHDRSQVSTKVGQGIVSNRLRGTSRLGSAAGAGTLDYRIAHGAITQTRTILGNQTMTVTVTNNGSTACRASVRFRAGGGGRPIVVHDPAGGDTLYASIQPINVSCVIAALPE